MARVLRVAASSSGPVAVFMAATMTEADIRSGYWPEAVIEEVEACGFDTGAGWGPWVCGNPAPCEEHGDLRCDCGQSATNLCSSASSFVCGYPICDEHRPLCERHR